MMFPKYNEKVKEKAEQDAIKREYDSRLKEARKKLDDATNDFLNSVYEKHFPSIEYLETKRIWGAGDFINIELVFKRGIGFNYTVNKYRKRDVESNISFTSWVSFNGYIRNANETETMEVLGVALDVIGKLRLIDWVNVFKNMPTLQDFIEKPTYRYIDFNELHNALLEDLMDARCWVRVKQSTSGCSDFLEPWLKVVGFTKKRIKVEIIDKWYPNETKTKKTIDKYSIFFKNDYENLEIAENIK